MSQLQRKVLFPTPIYFKDLPNAKELNKYLFKHIKAWRKSEPKGEVISSKIDRLAAICISNFRWAWRTQFLSHTLQILEINLSFQAFQMILLYLIKISFSF